MPSIESFIQALMQKANDGPPVSNNCRQCAHMRDVPGNCHIECVKPDAEMTGNSHGIRKGWFMYPLLFDPVWMTAKCRNFQPCEAVNRAGKPCGQPS